MQQDPTKNIGPTEDVDYSKMYICCQNSIICLQEELIDLHDELQFKDETLMEFTKQGFDLEQQIKDIQAKIKCLLDDAKHNYNRECSEQKRKYNQRISDLQMEYENMLEDNKHLVNQANTYINLLNLVADALKKVDVKKFLTSCTVLLSDIGQKFKNLPKTTTTGKLPIINLISPLADDVVVRESGSDENPDYATTKPKIQRRKVLNMPITKQAEITSGDEDDCEPKCKVRASKPRETKKPTVIRSNSSSEEAKNDSRHGIDAIRKNRTSRSKKRKGNVRSTVPSLKDSVTSSSDDSDFLSKYKMKTKKTVTKLGKRRALTKVATTIESNAANLDCSDTDIIVGRQRKSFLDSVALSTQINKETPSSARAIHCNDDITMTEVNEKTGKSLLKTNGKHSALKPTYRDKSEKKLNVKTSKKSLALLTKESIAESKTDKDLSNCSAEKTIIPRKSICKNYRDFFPDDNDRKFFRAVAEISFNAFVRKALSKIIGDKYLVYCTASGSYQGVKRPKIPEEIKWAIRDFYADVNQQQSKKKMNDFNAVTNRYITTLRQAQNINNDNITSREIQTVKRRFEKIEEERCLMSQKYQK